MTFRTVLIVLLALIFGGSAAIGINAVRNQQVEGSIKPAEKVPVVVVARDIPRWATITREMLELREYPRDLVPPRTFARLEDVIDRVAAYPLVKDDYILEAKLTPAGTRGGASGEIPEGMCLYAIQIPNEAAGVAGFILPHNKVDVWLTTSSTGSSGSGHPVAMRLLQHVEIWAVDQRVDPPSENKVNAREMRSVTLLLRPDQAGKLSAHQSKGSFHLALRKDGDKSSDQMETPPEPTPPPIRTLRGTNDSAVLVIPPSVRNLKREAGGKED